MKRLSAPFLFILMGLILRAAPSVDIPPVAQRAETVILAKKLIASQAIPIGTVDDAMLKNPFNPIVPASSPSVAALPEPSKEARLEQIAPTITPTGSIEMGGEALLLFGQKRFKVGDHLSIVFEGKPYQVEIIGIHSTSFTLRLNGVEITRPIKSVTKP